MRATPKLETVVTWRSADTTQVVQRVLHEVSRRGPHRNRGGTEGTRSVRQPDTPQGTWVPGSPSPDGALSVFVLRELFEQPLPLAAHSERT